MKQSADDLKRIRDKGIIDAELAMGASELVLEWLHALQERYRERFIVKQDKEGRR